MIAKGKNSQLRAFVNLGKRMNDLTDFRPPLWLRSANIQTALASSKLRNLVSRGFDAQSQKHIFDVGDGLKTSCYVNKHPLAKGMIILFHGWMGRPQSTYVLSAAKNFFDKGFSTARVTLPDHGDAAVLNKEMIPITRDSFLRGSVEQICDLEPSMPVGLIGFSMGGNCALRIARDLPKTPIQQVCTVVAVSPVIEPEETCTLIDKSPLIRRYFLRKFDRLYRQKQAQFPEYRSANELLNQRTLHGLTKRSVFRWKEFSSAKMYFSAYKIKKADFTQANIPVTLLTAKDDPIVSVNSARALDEGPNFERVFTSYGGHNGFFERFPRQVFSEQVALARFKKAMGVH